MDIYESIDRPMHMNTSLENVTSCFSKNSRASERKLLLIYMLFMRGFELYIYGATKTIVSEIFGRHPSDQYRALNYFISHIYNNFHHLVTDNLP